MQYSETQLKDQSFLEKIKNQAEDLIEYDNIHASYRLVKKLDKAISGNKEFRERYHDLYYQYKNIIAKLKWISIPTMTEDMVAEMFEKHFTKIFNISGYSYNELWRKLKSVLIGIVVLDDRDKFKKRLRSALMNNKEKITSKKILVNNNEVEATIENWIKDYNGTLGTGEISPLKKTQYLTNSRNVTFLTPEENKKIKLLFNLFEKLKLSSKDFEGLEEEISLDDENAKGIIKEGVFEPYKETKEDKLFQDILKTQSDQNNSEISLFDLKNMLTQYPEGSLERKVIEEEISKLESEK